MLRYYNTKFHYRSFNLDNDLLVNLKVISSVLKIFVNSNDPFSSLLYRLYLLSISPVCKYTYSTSPIWGSWSPAAWSSFGNTTGWRWGHVSVLFLRTETWNKAKPFYNWQILFTAFFSNCCWVTGQFNKCTIHPFLYTWAHRHLWLLMTCQCDWQRRESMTRVWSKIGL